MLSYVVVALLEHSPRLRMSWVQIPPMPVLLEKAVLVVFALPLACYLTSFLTHSTVICTVCGISEFEWHISISVLNDHKSKLLSHYVVNMEL